MHVVGSGHHARAERIAFLTRSTRIHAHAARPRDSTMRRRSSVIYRSQRPAPRLRSVGSAALLALLAARCSAGTMRSASPSRDPDAQEWIELFDGKTLRGWTPNARAR